MEDNLKKKQFIEWDYKYVWHPFCQMQEWLKEEPLFIVRGEGNYLIDIDGNRYFDAISSLWANIHGHNRKELNQAIEEQLHNIAHSTMLGLSNIPATILAKKLIEVSPNSLNKVFFSDTGSAANEIALKMAYQYWQHKKEKQKNKFITLEGSYHGDTIGAVSLGGIDLFHKIFNSLLFETFSIPNFFDYFSNFCSKKEASDYSLSFLEDILKKRHREISGLFTESYIQGASGMIIFPKSFMKSIRELCRKYNVLFILDEVATGFGRTGRLFACEEDNLDPDLMTLGKGITAGYLPLAATLASDEIYNSFLGDYTEYKSFFHGHTYTGNPLASSVAIASLNLFEKNQVLKHVQEIILFLNQELKKLLDLIHVGDIRQKGFMVGIELVKDKNAKIPFEKELTIGHKICMEARKHQLILRPLQDIIVLMPPLSTTKEEIIFLVEKLFLCIKKITESS